MAWPLRVIDPLAPEYEGHGWPAGSAWYAEPGRFVDRDRLSPQYLALPEPRRLPIVVAIPMRGTNWTWPFCVDEKASDSDQGWAVEGELPNITVRPSIDAGDAYHGFITAGVLGDG